MSELREFTRRLNVAEGDVRTARRDLTALRQGMRDGWSEVGGRRGCLTTISGKVIGSPFTTAALAGSTLGITGHVTGIDYGVFAVPSGTYSLGIILSPDDTSLDFVVTGPGARFQSGPPINRSIGVCSTNSLADLGATPAAGHHYFAGGAGGCQFPVREGMSFTNSLLGTNDLVWNGTYWDFCQNITSLNAGVCTSVNTNLWLQFFLSLAFDFRHPATLVGGPPGDCPIAGSCPTFPSLAKVALAGTAGTMFSITCPGVTTDFSATWKYSFSSPGSPIFGIASGEPITFYETPI